MNRPEKILLLNPPGARRYLRDNYCSHISKGNYYWHPYDLVALSGLLAQRYDITVIDAIVERLDEDTCRKRILQEDFYAVLFVTGAVSWVRDLQFMKGIKKERGPLLIASGDIGLFEFKMLLRENPFLDAVLMDFTDSGIMEYLESPDKGPFENVYYLDAHLEPVGSWERKKRTFSLTLPRHALFPLRKYTLPHTRFHPFISTLTSFGCPHACGFCPCENLPFKVRSIENMIEELDCIAGMGVRELWLKDQCFGADRAHSIAVMQAMLARRYHFSWSVEARADTIDEEFIDFLKGSGCHTVMMGVESARDEILARHGKMLKREAIDSAFKLCRSRNVRTLAHFCLGLPGETDESIAETVDLALRLPADYLSFNIATPQPGTTMRREALEKGWIEPSCLEYDSSCSYPVLQTPWLKRETLWRHYRSATRRFYLSPGFILASLFKIRSLSEAGILFREGISYLLNRHAA